MRGIYSNMKNKRKKYLRNQVRRQKAIKIVATASTVGMLGVAVQTQTVKADSIENVRVAVTETSSELTSLESVTELNDISESDNVELVPTAEEIVSEIVDEVSAPPLAERYAGITYKVTYTEVGTHKVVKTEHKSIALRTTDSIATTEVTEVADLPVGYRLAQGHVSSQKVTLTEKQANEIIFIVYRDEDIDFRTSDGGYFRSENDTSAEQPYATIENYTKSDHYFKNGGTVDISYKIGLTRINADDVELSPDATTLGLSFDRNSLFIKGTITLSNAIESKVYNIGLVSKTNQSTIVNAELTISETLGFVLRPLGAGNQYWEARGIPYYGGDGVNVPSVQPVRVDDTSVSSSSYIYNNEYRDDNGIKKPINEITYDLSMPVTTFGYFMPKLGGTIADVTPETKQYFSEVILISADSIEDLNNKQQKIVHFEQLSGKE